ncbi:branched-chain amino acid ABC transporter substrate-binding protein [Nocardioides sp.]|uniref:branched-chain amino acid ABC transporter substrate-binding protein n=1 Tax=Nocardioides sp. TaxID=35761 RepID=UPI00271ABC0D|nr:branched-chain amino acid ABC transporter substrate-binding protein [Nocardioides sp.]MDO9455318.1 branched-chain amino acid ABC transporter substrate-binding protein [Nocardioides sp.]
MAALLVGASLAACGTTDDEGGSGGGGGGDDAACAGKIGAMGALSGPNASIVIPSVNGAKLALSQFLEENSDCDIELVPFDSEGDAAKATPLASQIADDADFLGVIGGAFSGETRATKGIFDEAGVTMISQSATATDLTTEDVKKVFHRVVGYDDIQGEAVATYISDTLGATKPFVVDNSEAYGEPLAATVISSLGDAVAGTDKTQVGQTEFSATISKIEAADADAVFYAGYIAEAAPLLKQIRDAGLEIPVVFPDGVYGADFPKAAGSAGEGAIITCPCVPIEDGEFSSDYEAEFGEKPGAYAAEGFDAMTVFLDAIKSGATDRAAVAEFVNSYDEPGLTKQIKFDDKGDISVDNVVIWSYKVEGDVLVPDQEISLS